jgi:hypothetical protein
MIPASRPPTYEEYRLITSVLYLHEEALTEWLHAQNTNITAQDIIRCIINKWPYDNPADQPANELIGRLNHEQSAALFDPAVAARCLRIAISALAAIADRSEKASDTTWAASKAEHTLDTINMLCDSQRLAAP